MAPGKGVDWNIASLEGTIDSGVSDKQSIHAPKHAVDEECGENFGQVPMATMEEDKRLVPVDQAMENVVSNLCKEVGQEAMASNDSMELSNTCYTEA